MEERQLLELELELELEALQRRWRRRSHGGGDDIASSNPHVRGETTAPPPSGPQPLPPMLYQHLNPQLKATGKGMPSSMPTSSPLWPGDPVAPAPLPARPAHRAAPPTINPSSSPLVTLMAIQLRKHAEIRRHRRLRRALTAAKAAADQPKPRIAPETEVLLSLLTEKLDALVSKTTSSSSSAIPDSDVPAPALPSAMTGPRARFTSMAPMAQRIRPSMTHQPAPIRVLGEPAEQVFGEESPATTASTAAVVPAAMPLLDPNHLTQTLAELLKDEDSDNEGESKTPAGATPRTPAAPLTPATMRNTMRNKNRKLGTAFLSLWGLDDLAKPRWRYLMAGQPLPEDPQLVLKGKSIFRAAGVMVLFMVGQHRAVLRRKALTKDQDAAGFQLAYPLYHDQCKAWVTKATRVIITSLLKDDKLKLEPSLRPIALLPSIFAASMMKRPEEASKIIKIKVRIKSMITGLCAELPPAPILQILTGFCTDGVYFPTGFLFDQERDHLQFDELGATRCMIRPLLNDQDQPLDPQYLREVPELGGRVDATRVAMMVVDILLVRVLVDQVLLKAHARTDLIATNLKVLATVVYVLVRMLNRDLLDLAAPKGKWGIGRGGAGPAKEKESGADTEAAGATTATTAAAATTTTAAAPAPVPAVQDDRLVSNEKIVAGLMTRDQVSSLINEDSEVWLRTYRDMLQEWVGRIVDQIIQKLLPKPP